MKINNAPVSFGMKVPTRDIVANTLELFIDGSGPGSTKSVDKTCSALIGTTLGNNADVNWYRARAAVKSFVSEKFPDLAEKLGVVKAKMVEEYGPSTFAISNKDREKILDIATKKLKKIGIGKKINITM